MKNLVRMSAATVAALGLLVVPAGVAAAHDNGNGQGHQRGQHSSSLSTLTSDQVAAVQAARAAYRQALRGAMSSYRVVVAPIRDAIRNDASVVAAKPAVDSARANLRSVYASTISTDADKAAARDALKKAHDELEAAIKAALGANQATLDKAKADLKTAVDAAKAAYTAALVGIFGSEADIPSFLVNPGGRGHGLDKGGFHGLGALKYHGGRHR
ncbi:MAG: hypothetical protein GC156_09320 [Actinomycetales bacterium]|nr:hypothetical protein [Actinomycetales bacterium]